MDPVLKVLMEKISEELGKPRTMFTMTHVYKYVDKLQLVDAKEIVIYLYTIGVGRAILWLSFKFWKDLSYKDWHHILREICESRGDLYKFLPFVYNYLEIDMITVLLEDPEISEVSKEYVKKTLTFPDKPIQPHFGITDQKINFHYLYKYGINKDDLKSVKERLINEGALEASKKTRQL